MAKVVTFDFDGTLTLIEWDEQAGAWINSDKPSRKMIRLLKRIHDRGYEVHVVTRRCSAWEADDCPVQYEKVKVGKFLDEHGLTRYVTRVHFCGDRSWNGDKADILRELGSIRHYDDMQEHVAQATRAGAKGRKVPRPAGSE